MFLSIRGLAGDISLKRKIDCASMQMKISSEESRHEEIELRIHRNSYIRRIE